MPKPMSNTEYGRALDALGLSNRAFCLEIVDTDDRTGRNWKSGEARVPGAVAALLRLAIKLKLTPDKLRELVK